jgi:hypothetical protein
MIQLLWLSIGAIALAIWVYHHRPLRANDFGSVSARWLQQHLNGTHYDR